MGGIIEQDVKANEMAKCHTEVRVEAHRLRHKGAVPRLAIQMNLAVSGDNGALAIEDHVRIEDIVASWGARTGILRSGGAQLPLTDIDDNVLAGLAGGARDADQKRGIVTGSGIVDTWR